MKFRIASLHFFNVCVGDPGKKENISYYEVGAGTSRTNESQLTSVHPFVQVGLNKTWRFNGLNLNMSIMYYVAVRAYSQSGVVSKSISNGVKVVKPTFVTPGVVEVARYVYL